MKPSEFSRLIFEPGLTFLHGLAPEVPVSRSVRVLLLAIAGQESNWSARVQAGNGPGHSHWQFERADMAARAPSPGGVAREHASGKRCVPNRRAVNGIGVKNGG